MPQERSVYTNKMCARMSTRATFPLSPQVTLTTKFRGPLASGQFPHVPTHNWSSGTQQFTDTWQFSLVLPWLGGLVVTHNDCTLCVLDPTTSTVAGVLCLEHPITCISVSGKFVYVLSNEHTRPLARFTAHASYLKSLQKTSKTGGVAGSRSEEDLLSVTEDGGDNRLGVGGREWSSVSVSTRDSEESERFVKEGELRERSVLSAVSETREIHSINCAESPVSEEPAQNSNDKLATAETPITTNRQLSEDPPQATIGSGGEMLTRLPEVQLCQDGATDDNVLEQNHSTPDEANIETITSLHDAIETETTTPTTEQDGPEDKLHNEEEDFHVRDPELDGGTEAPPTARPTTQAGSSGGPERPHFMDPPSVTGPMGVQDLAREVTDLLRPALGKLSTLMKERKRDGGAAGGGGAVRGTSPRESPLVEHHQSEKEDGERGGGKGRGRRDRALRWRDPRQS